MCIVGHPIIQGTLHRKSIRFNIKNYFFLEVEQSPEWTWRIRSGLERFAANRSWAKF